MRKEQERELESLKMKQTKKPSVLNSTLKSIEVSTDSSLFEKGQCYLCVRSLVWENLMSIEETSGRLRYPYGKEGEWDIGYDDYESYYSKIVGYLCNDCNTRYRRRD